VKSPDPDQLAGVDPAVDPTSATAGPPVPIHVQLGDVGPLAVRFRWLTRDPLRASVLRVALARATAPPPPARWGEPQLFRLALPRLLRGDLIARPAAKPLPRSMLVAEPAEAPAPVAPPPPPVTEKKPLLGWIEIQLVDQDDKPRKGERYKLKLPDGSVREGKLNDNGLVRASDIPTGSCEVSFLYLDASEWKIV
jgi:hypothetical protein